MGVKQYFRHSPDNYSPDNRWVDTTEFQDGPVDCRADLGSCSVDRIGLVAGCTGRPTAANCGRTTAAAVDNYC